DESFDEEDFELDEVDVRDLLRSALKTPPASERAIERGVQRRIREDTKGQFFGDGWSVSTAPKATFLVTSLLMLALVILAWLLLTPRGL
ncbi:MAG: hypothetical protein KC731_07445, partial [Myxococcales bacterium]|nr:hypothetical protein [Myxococcales bacterium]